MLYKAVLILLISLAYWSSAVAHKITSNHHISTSNEIEHKNQSQHHQEIISRFTNPQRLHYRLSIGKDYGLTQIQIIGPELQLSFYRSKQVALSGIAKFGIDSSIINYLKSNESSSESTGSGGVNINGMIKKLIDNLHVQNATAYKIDSIYSAAFLIRSALFKNQSSSRATKVEINSHLVATLGIYRSILIDSVKNQLVLDILGSAPVFKAIVSRTASGIVIQGNWAAIIFREIGKKTNYPVMTDIGGYAYFIPLNGKYRFSVGYSLRYESNKPLANIIKITAEVLVGRSRVTIDYGIIIKSKMDIIGCCKITLGR